MLQDIRQNVRGTGAKIIIGLIVASFALFGIESVLFGGGSNTIAEVNGEEIDQRQLQQAIVTQQNRLIQMMGENFDPAMLEESRLRNQALEAIISRKLLIQSAQEMDLRVSKEEIGRVLGAMEQFQSDGEFSPELFQRILADNGYTPASFQDSLRGDLLLNQIRTGLAASEFATPAELSLTARSVAEKRDFRYLTIPRESVKVEADVSEAGIKAYYEEHQSQFMTEEAVDVAYIEVDLDDFRQPVEEAALRDAYEVARGDLSSPTENRVSHILFAEEQGSALQQQVDEARAMLADGVEFAEVARRLSDDAGSAARGGDLGYSSGDAFPETMEQAVAELDVGEVSEPVQTDAGTHLVLVTERRDVEAPTYEEMRPQLLDKLQSEEARVELMRTVEDLRNLAFNAGDLQLVSEELDLEVAEQAGVTRSRGEGPFANDAVREAAFSSEVLEQGYNSEVIELAPDHFVVLRVRQHRPPQPRPPGEVRETIVAAIKEEAAEEKLAAEAKRMLARLRDGAAMDALARDSGYEWQVEIGAGRRGFAVSPEVLSRVFALPAPAEQDAINDYLITQTGDAVVVQLIRVRRGDYDALPREEQEQLQDRIAAEYANLVNAEYRMALRRAAEINVM